MRINRRQNNINCTVASRQLLLLTISAISIPAVLNFVTTLSPPIPILSEFVYVTVKPHDF